MSEQAVQERVRIAGVLAIPRVSRNMNLYLPSELEAAVRRLNGQPIPIYWEHVEANRAIGTAVLRWNPEKLQVEFEGEVFDPEAEEKIRSGAVRKVSLAADYERLDKLDGVNVPRGLQFRELSLVAVPGIPEANITVVESGGAYILRGGLRLRERAEGSPSESQENGISENAEKAEDAVPPPNESSETEEKVEEVVPQVSDFPIASPDRGWDADAAVARIRRWASSDGSGEKDQIDWAKYRRAFLWYDESDPENFGSYALPYVDIIDGRPHIIPRAVVAIAAVLQGARGGFDRASREEIEAIRSRVAALYRRIHMKYDDFPEAPPWEREEESSSKNTLENVSEPMENPSSEPGKVAEQPIVVEAVGETAKVVEKKSIVESLMDFLRKGLREAVTGYPSEFSVARDAIYQELGIVPRLRRHVIAKDVPEGADRARFVVVPPLQFNATVDEATQALSFVDVTVTEVGRRQSVTYTDLEDSVVDLQAIIRNSFVRAAAYHEDRTIIDALATATGVTAIDRTGASPSTLTYDYLVEAIQTLKSKVKFALNSGDIVVLVHPKQYESLLKDPEVREVMRFGGEEPKQEGRIPMLAGARIVETDLVPSNYDPTTGNTDYTAILFVDGYSVGFAAKRDLRIEQERVPRERKVYYVATMRVGAKVLDPNSVVHLKTRNG